MTRSPIVKPTPPDAPSEFDRVQAHSEPDPLTAAVEPEKVVTMEDLGIGALDPYPTSEAPPPPEEDA